MAGRRRAAARHAPTVVDTLNWYCCVQHSEQTGMPGHSGPWQSHDSAPSKGATFRSGGTLARRARAGHLL